MKDKQRPWLALSLLVALAVPAPAAQDPAATPEKKTEKQPEFPTFEEVCVPESLAARFRKVWRVESGR
jgi:hypothetical protein